MKRTVVHMSVSQVGQRLGVPGCLRRRHHWEMLWSTHGPNRWTRLPDIPQPTLPEVPP